MSKGMKMSSKELYSRIYLVGNPDELGYTKEETSSGSVLSFDSEGVAWYHVTTATSHIIFSNEKEPPQSLSGLWFDNCLYHEEHFKTREEWERSKKSRALIENAEKDEKARKKLFELSPPITKYAVPNEGTEARRVFNLMVNMFWHDTDRENEKRKKIRELMGEIGRAL